MLVKIKQLFKPTTAAVSVDSIITNFNTQVQQLQELALAEDTNATSLQELAAGYITKANQSVAEANRARNIATKISNLIK